MNSRPFSLRKTSFLLIVSGLFLSLLALWILLTVSRWEGHPPRLSFDRNFTSLGKHSDLILKIEDKETGLRKISVKLKLKAKTISLVNEHYSGPPLLSLQEQGNQISKTFNVGQLITKNYLIREGPARLEISAKDHSFRRFFGGNEMVLHQKFTFDIHPPRLEVLSKQHYIHQGGAECILYKVSEDAVSSGVRVGPDFFPGYSVNPSENELHFSIFAYRYDLAPNQELKLVARDESGNETAIAFWHKFFPKNFRRRKIILNENFLQTVVPTILNENPQLPRQGDLVKDFVQINDRLRQINHEKIKEISRKSDPQLLWTEAFSQLSRSKVESVFADHRTYFYNGKVIDRQDHVGFDLAVTRHYPIEAANNGIVRHAEKLGIYGNTVLLDHGCGLLSLYGHLSSIEVEVGQQVKKGQELGRSGATGLAAGDHLHFSLFLHGVPLNPTEWWDNNWVQTHILQRLHKQDRTTGKGTSPSSMEY